MPEPEIVRLGWDKGATPNLMNEEGLPTPAFSSDYKKRLLPEGKNHALNKPYTCSDENKHGSSWKKGLTDGSWGEDGLHCFASNESDNFPKYATIDLQQTIAAAKVYLGVPGFGSTKTVKIQLSEDGKEFETVGEYQFSLEKAEKTLISFPPQKARYVRLAYTENYDQKKGYNPNFVFTTEVEVYSE